MVEWLEAEENQEGIKTIAFETLNPHINHHQIVGYNGILKGDEVLFEKKPYTIVMVSRLGHFGLSTTGELPYSVCAYPTKVSPLVKRKKVMKDGSITYT